MMEFTLAIAGVTGAVGEKMAQVLQERKIRPTKVKMLASSRSAGKIKRFYDQDVIVELLNENSFKGIDFALFSAGGDVSRQFSPIAARSGTVVVDNSSAFRMDDDVPLVVPEVNPKDAFKHKGIIANPNCSTIQMVVVLKPIHDAFGIKRVVVSTYQSVSGTGWKAVLELRSQVEKMMKNEPMDPPKVYSRHIAFNVLPQIDGFLENGYTREEMKMVNETRKIMHEPDMRITATTVRVPVFFSHSESVNLELKRHATPMDVAEVLESAPGVKVMDDFVKNRYPTNLDATGTDLSYVGRIRQDFSIENGINLWIVSDNLRKGAATNAVQILELLLKG
jgi:aspartate-semialdehyde dehydrogenase